MFTEPTSVGLDVHARSVVAHGLDVWTGEIFKARLCPDPVEVTGWIKALPGPATERLHHTTGHYPDDPTVPPGMVDHWSAFTTARFKLQVVPGGHFFPVDAGPGFLDTVADGIDAMLADR